MTKRLASKRNPLGFAGAFSKSFVADKFGKSTTHWRKLEERIQRGLGSPCPLLLIGLPSSVITLHEGRAALAEVMNDREEDSSAD